MNQLNWSIFNGASFESLVHSVLFFEDPTVILFGRPGADAGQDAITRDKTHVYQAKYGKNLTFSDAIKRAKDELTKIRDYKKENSSNFQYWKNVNHWTLVCNATINPSDYAKWEDEIIKPFANLGMELDYWDATILEAKLINYPDVKNAYFGGQNRCLLGMWEAREHLEKGFLGKNFFKSQFLNQSQAFQVFDDFQKDSTKSLLILKGEFGSGKTRFLYESALKVCENEITSFWGLSPSMGISDSWFLGITNSKKELYLIVDNVSLSLLDRIYDQLSIVGRSSWKVIVSLNNDIQAIHLEKYKQRNDTLVTTLAPLSPDDITSYIKAFGYDPKKFKLNSIEQRLYDLTSGNPLTLSIMLSENSPNNRDFTLTQNVLTIVNNCIRVRLARNNFNDLVQKQRHLLRWIAVYKTIHIHHSHENPSLYDFLCQETNSTASELNDALNALVENNLLIRWGENETHYTIDSDLICREILQEWLLQKNNNNSYQLNTVGNSFINGLLEKNIPYLDIALKNLSLFIATYLLPPEQEEFFAPLFVKISNECLGDDILACEKGLQSLKQIAHLNFENALSLLKEIWEYSKKCDPQKISTWHGDALYTYQDVLSKIEEIIFSIAHSTNGDHSPLSIWQLIKRYHNEISATPQIECPQFYTNLSALLEDITVGSYYRDLAFNDPSLLDKYYSKFHLTILNSLLKPKYQSTTRYKRTITFSTRYIVPDTKEWTTTTTLRKSLFELLQQENIPEEVELAYWNILVNTHGLWRNVDFSKHPNSSIKERYNSVVLDDLNETYQIISSKDIPLKVLLTVRQIWEYTLRFPNSMVEKDAAERCENIFKTYFRWDFARLFSWHEKDNIDDLINDIVRFIKNATTCEEINLFFTSATEYLNLKKNSYDHGRSQEILNQTFNLYTDEKQPAFCEFINTEITHAKGFGTFKDNFIVLFLKKWIRLIKDNNKSQNVSQELTRLLKDSPTQGELLYSVYAQSAPSSLGGTTIDEFNYLFSHRDNFTIEQFFEILPTFLNVAEREIKQFVLGILEQNKNNPQQLNKLWFLFANAAYHVILYEHENDLDIPNPISWLMQAFIDFNINGEYLEEYNIERLAEFGNYKISQVDFLSLITQRIALVQGGNSHFEILPNEFHVDKWLSIDQDDNMIQQICKLIFKGETYFSRHQLAKLLPTLTQNVTPIINYIQNELTKNSGLSPEILYNLGRIPSFYSDETQEWEQMITPICQAIYRSEIDKKDRYRIYASFQNRSYSYSFRIGEIPSEVIQRKEFVERKRLLEQTPAYLKEYWNWSLQCALSDYNHFADEAEAQKYE